jgi:hypothetical protein
MITEAARDKTVSVALRNNPVSERKVALRGSPLVVATKAGPRLQRGPVPFVCLFDEGRR